MEFRRLKEPLHFEEAVKANLERSVRAFVTKRPTSFAAQLPRFFFPATQPGGIRPRIVNRIARLRFRAPATAPTWRPATMPSRSNATGACFPTSRFRIFLLEDLQSRPAEVLCDVCHLLGISTEPVKDIECRSENVGKP